MRRPTSLPSSARWLAAAAILLAAAACSSSAKPPPAPDPADADFVVQDNRHSEKVATHSLASMTPVDSPDGRRFYLFTPLCCDQFNKLYDADGSYICAPSGGFTGQGDGKCPTWVHDLERKPSPPKFPREQPQPPR